MNEIHYYRDENVVLYKRERSKRWQARFKLPNNKWKRISTKKTDLKDASEIACDQYDEMRFRIKHNLAMDSRRFKDVAKLAISGMKTELESGYGKKVYRHYISALNRYLIPFYGNTHIDKIDYKLLREFDHWRIKKIKREPKASTVTTHNSALNRVFRTALERGWLLEVQIPHLTNKGLKSERRPYFTREEYQELYKFMRDWHTTGSKQKTRDIRELLRDYVLILANTGMRHGTETANLKWNQIDEFKDNSGEKYLRFYVKGKTGERELVARHNVRNYLKRIQDRFEDLKDLDYKELTKVDEFVFRCCDGSKVKDWHGAFEILLNEADLLKDKHGKNRTLYSLRHTYATFALNSNVDIHILARQMGTSTYMLEKHYSHLVPSMAAKTLAGKRFEQSYKGDLSSQIVFIPDEELEK